MNTDERKAVTEAWLQATKSTKQHVMVQIGGTNLPDVLELVCLIFTCKFFAFKISLVFRHNMQKQMVQILYCVFLNYTINLLQMRN